MTTIETPWVHRYPDSKSDVLKKYFEILDVMQGMSLEELSLLRDDYDKSYMTGNLSIADYHTLRFCADVIIGVVTYPKWERQPRNTQKTLNRGKNGLHM